ncbi:hypothetical protein [Chamaesiphon sp. OTE_75_metabat_556]|uniref:hypothetical protein n=1 Tax=Chamaesiphon sp. OTE_75_metabat_556 TaxID=2964692 RepID=UPI00286AC85A|nr:hypothetical protein [Chamaesiphon sp. OTE_75_metabat_556]
MPRKRKTNRDHAKRQQRPMMEDEAIAAQLEQLVTPAVIAQERYYRQRLSRLYGDKYCLFE